MTITNVISPDAPTTVTEQSSVDDFNAQNKAMENQKLQDKYKAEMTAFDLQMQALLSAQESKKRDVPIGEYVITVQSECDYKIDLQPPTLGTFERDCYSAEAKADVTAQMIVNSAPSNPPSLESIKGAITNCELALSTERSITIKNLCYEEGLVANFKAILDEYDDDMAASGLTKRVDNADGSVTYSSGVLTSEKIDLQTHTATAVDKSGLIGTDAGAIPN
jgi:hypothetical protein